VQSEATHGTGQDNPLSPMNLTALQAARSFAVFFEDKSEFYVTLDAGEGWGGRNFLFAGMSQLVLAAYPECCPSHICKTGPEMTVQQHQQQYQQQRRQELQQDQPRKTTTTTTQTQRLSV
jgi:hypothetical protein